MKLITAICISLYIIFIGVLAQTPGQEIISQQFNASGADKLEGLANNMTNGFSPDFSFSSTTNMLTQGSLDFSLENIFKRIIAIFTAEVKGCSADAAKIFIIIIILSTVARFSSGTNTFDTAFYVCYVLLFGIALSAFNAVAQMCKTTIDNMEVFMKTAVPVMTALNITAGNASASGLSVVALYGIYLTGRIIHGIMIPLIYISAAMCAVNNISEDFGLKGVTELIKKCVHWGLTFLLTLFSGIVIAQGLTQTAFNNVSGKMLKMAVGSFIPVIGKVLADSIDTVAACGQLIKNAVGIAGILALTFMCLLPIIKLIAIIAVYKILCISLSPIAHSRITEALDEFTGTMGLLFLMLVAISFLFIVFLAVMAMAAPGIK